MVMLVPFGLVSLVRKGADLLTRSAAMFTVVVSVICIHFSRSRGSTLGLFLIVGVMLLDRIKNKKMAIIAACCALGVAFALMQRTSRGASDLEQSSSSRMTMIKTGLIMGAKNPILGVGFNGYTANFEKYATELLYEWGHRTAHNSWVLAFAETGLIGFLVFVATFWSAWLDARKVWLLRPEFFLALVGYGLAMSFLSHTFLPYLYFLYALIISASRIYRQDELKVGVVA
jgi:O-antigen ligase